MPKRSAFPNRYSFAALPEPTVERNGQRVSLFDALHDEVTFIDVKPNRESKKFEVIDRAQPLTQYTDNGPLHFLNFQNDKYGWFLRDGLKKAFDDISPIKDSTGKLSLYLEFDPTNPESISPPKHSEAECIERGLTYQRPVFVNAEFRNEDTGEIKQSFVFMGDVPVMTERGTFIYSGTERVVVSQLLRSDGIYIEPGLDQKGNVVFTATLIPVRGERPKFTIETGDVTRVVARLGKGKKVNALTVLRAMDSRVTWEVLSEAIYGNADKEAKFPILQMDYERYRTRYNDRYDKEIKTAINRSNRQGGGSNKLAKFAAESVAKYDVAITKIGTRRNAVVEAISAITSKDATQADSILKSPDRIVASFQSTAYAQGYKEILEAAGASVELKMHTIDALTMHLAVFHGADESKRDQASQEMALIETYKAWKGLEPADRWLDIFDIEAWRAPSAPVPGDASAPNRFRNAMESRIEPYFRNLFLDPTRPLLPNQALRGSERTRARASFEMSELGLQRISRKFERCNEIELNRSVFGPLFDEPQSERRWLSPEEVLATVTYLLNLRMAYLDERSQNASDPASYRTDDVDQLSNRRIRSVGELVLIAYRGGLSRMERTVRDRMQTIDSEAITPTGLINIRPVVAAVREFFSSSQLSQYLDNTNPLSSLTNKRRLSALGVGGLTRERAGLEVRDVLASYYGRICPIETPEGPNVGLIGYFSNYAMLDQYGFVNSPVRLVRDGVVTNEFRWVDYESEPYMKIAAAETELEPNGRIKEDKVLIRTGAPGTGIAHFKNSEMGLGSTVAEFSVVKREDVDAIDISPIQHISLSTALIPFVEHDDAQRALMGANMQRQAVPLIVPEAPYVGTGLEARAAIDSGEVLLAEATGVVTEVSGDRIVVEYDEAVPVRDAKPVKKKSYRLNKFRRSNQGTSMHQRARVSVGDAVVKGEILADGTSTSQGELALGKNLLVAYMSWEGFNFEDAIIVSERLVKDDVLTSVHIETYECDARDVKLGQEEITRDIPNLPENLLAHLDDRGIIRIGSEVAPGDILVGKVTPKGESDPTPEERLLRAIFGDKADDVRDVSMRLPHGQFGTVIGVKVIERDGEEELQPGVNQLVRVFVAQKRKIAEGDKLAGRHGNKGVISRVLPEEDMPYLADGTPVDIILSPLGVPSRMNVGQLLESHLGYAARHGWSDVESNELAGTAGHGDAANRKTRPRTEPALYVSSPVFDGARWDQDDPRNSKPNIKQIFSTLNNDGQQGQRLLGTDGKAVLYNGRTGEPYDNPVHVGYAYILKLNHMVDDKVHARSTGPYALVTQQPIGGKAQFGGQRFGEMEVWALEAYGAAHALQELITVKSDDTRGRELTYEAIVKGENLPTPGVPESFKALVKEMQALCLNVEIRSSNGRMVQLADADLDSDIGRRLHINITRHEHGSDEDDARRAKERAERTSFQS